MSAVKPIPDISAALASQPTSDLLLRAFAIVKRWKETDPSEDVGLEINWFDGEWQVCIKRSVKDEDGFRTFVIGGHVGLSLALQSAIAQACGESDPIAPAQSDTELFF